MDESGRFVPPLPHWNCWHWWLQSETGEESGRPHKAIFTAGRCRDNSTELNAAASSPEGCYVCLYNSCCSNKWWLCVQTGCFEAKASGYKLSNSTSKSLSCSIFSVAKTFLAPLPNPSNPMTVVLFQHSASAESQTHKNHVAVNVMW